MATRPTSPPVPIPNPLRMSTQNMLDEPMFKAAPPPVSNEFSLDGFRWGSTWIPAPTPKDWVKSKDLGRPENWGVENISSLHQEFRSLKGVIKEFQDQVLVSLNLLKERLDLLDRRLNLLEDHMFGV